jgi:hypothetical protein
MKLLLLLLLLVPGILHAQPSDILLLQKKQRTIRQFFAGSQIDFYTTEHMGVSAVVDYIKRDSLFLLQYDIKMMPNIFGTFAPDTLAVYKIQFSLKNIYSFPAKPKRFAFLTNGTLLMIGGSAYLAVNIINTLREHDPPFGKDNLPNIIGGVAAFAAGFLLHNAQTTEYKLGKKYQLKYLQVSDSTTH